MSYISKNKKNNSKWPETPDHPHKILIIRSGKTNALRNLINPKPYRGKIYLYAKDPHEGKYQLLFDKRESLGLDKINFFKDFIVYSDNMDVVIENIDKCNPDKERHVLIVSYDMIADTLNNKQLNSIVTESFIRGRNLNSSLVFLRES